MSSSWFSSLPPAQEERRRLFCFPYAGGGSRCYAGWQQLLGPQTGVWAVVPPGRDGRLLERPYTAMTPLVTDLVNALSPHLDRPFAFFGHSLGAAVAYETAQRLRQLGLPQPQGLIVSGRRAPHSPVPPPYPHLISDSALIAEVGGLGGLPDKARQRPRALRALLPILRADYQIHDTYVASVRRPLSLPLFGYAAQDDPIARTADVDAWRQATTGPFRLRQFDGGHFYLRSAPAEVTAAVHDDLGAAVRHEPADVTRA